MSLISLFRMSYCPRVSLAFALVAGMAASAAAEAGSVPIDEAVEKAHGELWRRFIARGLAADVSGDERWQAIYRQAVTERSSSDKPSRLEVCAKGMVSALQSYHTWTACPGVVGLRGLWELETDPALKAAYEEGLRASATVGAESLPLAVQFDNNDQQEFLIDWRELNTLWHEQKSVSEASKLARKQLDLLDSLSPRRGYEARFVREPMFAAWVVSLCPDLAVLRQHAPAIVKAIRHYRYERLYISQYFPGEAAYYRLKLSGIALD